MSDRALYEERVHAMARTIRSICLQVGDLSPAVIAELAVDHVNAVNAELAKSAGPQWGDPGSPFEADGRPKTVNRMRLELGLPPLEGRSGEYGPDGEWVE